MRKLILTLTLLFTWAVHASDIEIIQLHNRQADELIPVLEPLLDSSDALSGSGYQLIVRTSPQRLSQIERLVRQLDTELQQLTISVRHDGGRNESDQGYSASGSMGTGTIRIGVDGPSAPRGGSITTHSPNGSGSIRVYRSDNQQSNNLSQRLTVLEGRWATINTGLVVPIQHQQGTGYADATSGFDVRPRLNGSEVTLEIAPYRRKLSSGRSGTIDTQSINSTVRGRLGEWIEIGGVNETSSGSESGIGYTGSSRSSDARSVWLKVELAQ